MQPERLNIFQYSDFRLFLSDFYARKKAENKRFSHRLIHEKLKASSSGWFSDILKGRIKLTGAFLPGLIKLMELNPSEADFFEVLVLYQQAGSHEEKLRHLKKILSFKEIESDLLSHDKFEFYSTWYHAVIRELLIYFDFSGDYQTLAAQLAPPITPRQARASLALLENLGLVQKGSHGVYRPTADRIKKDPEFKTLLLNEYHKKNLELALDALLVLDKAERDVSSVTVGLTREGFEQARAEIKQLRKKLLEMEHTAGEKRRIYQFNIQGFPVSKQVNQKESHEL